MSRQTQHSRTRWIATLVLVISLALGIIIGAFTGRLLEERHLR